MTRVKSIHPDAFVVHRLDYGTSGVLVLGLNKSAISNLGKQFIARGVHKVYVAWVAGKLEGTGAVDLPLILDLEHRPFQKVDFEVGKKALTYYQALEYDAAQDRTFVRLFPQTGRSHQLRVHMQQLGHPILGDHLATPIFTCGFAALQASKHRKRDVILCPCTIPSARAACT